MNLLEVLGLFMFTIVLFLLAGSSILLSIIFTNIVFLISFAIYYVFFFKVKEEK